MKIIRYESQGEVHYGVLDGGKVRRVAGGLGGVAAGNVTGDTAGLDEVRLLAPVDPRNIIAIGLNYSSHAAEGGEKPPAQPLIFLKATNSLAGHGDAIILPAIAPNEVDYEAELAVVIGKTAKDVTEADALDYALGYTCGNDVSARDCQLRIDTQWARGKSFDTFCPIGPHIETEIADPGNLNICSRVNGRVMQSSNTRNMIFSVRALISYCSRNMTLTPGTVIMTGTPEGVGFARKPPVFLRDGDTVEIEIEGIGILRNTVKAAV